MSPDIRRYSIVRSRSSVSSNFLVFATHELALEYIKGTEAEKDFYIEDCYDPFMTLNKFMQLPEFGGF